MVLSPEEASKVRTHLLKQAEKVPVDNKDEIVERVNAMSDDELEEFIRENKLTHLGNQCVFCSIVAGTNPSFKVLEDKDNLAVLELNPLSRGHVLVIPRVHAGVITDASKNFAKEVASFLASRLMPKEVKISPLLIMDHALLEVVPLFGSEKDRWSASQKELKELQELLVRPVEPVKVEVKKEVIPDLPPSPIFKLPPRIP